MNRLALRMLFGDHAKYLMLISGITFATILMTQGAALFCGLMSWMYAPLRNVQVPVWVTDPKVEQINDFKPLRDTDVSRVRSVSGVAWAVPLYQGTTQAKLADGSSKLITLMGLDATTLIGAPTGMLAGHLDHLRFPDAVIIDEYGVERLSEGRATPVGIGDTFEINDRTARIVGICVAHRSFTGGPFVYTTY
ncbi:MAG TPA: ABC transporter permease, partial [Candidatus Synoicihabitans sp.]|nr:ABC transporter permease [Candidatus Synoicihabitans sp.]